MRMTAVYRRAALIPRTHLFVPNCHPCEYEIVLIGMRIAIVGTGHIGGRLADLLLSGPHEIVLGVRDQAAIEECKRRHPGATVQVAAAAMDGSDAIVLAVPWPAVEEVLKHVRSLAGKVLIETTNPLLPDLSGLVDTGGVSVAETIQQWKPEARVVKAFNTLGAEYLGNGQVGGSVADGFYCGDDTEAKAIAAELIAQAGLQPQDVGPLRNARYLEAIAMLWIDMAVNQRRAGRFAFRLLSEPAKSR